MPEEKPRRSRQIITSFEAKALKKRPISIRIADYLTSSFGTIHFLLANFLLFIVWILVNSGKIPTIPIFDPFPFILLTMVVSLEAIFLSIIVLMSQNRQSQISSLREEFDMQVNLISEREITKALKLLKEIRGKLLGDSLIDAELEEMVKKVDTSYIERKLTQDLSEKPEPILKKVAEEFEKTISRK